MILIDFHEEILLLERSHSLSRIRGVKWSKQLMLLFEADNLWSFIKDWSPQQSDI